jgi:hypothetical protein
MGIVFSNLIDNAIEEKRKRPLIVYVTSQRPSSAGTVLGQMAGDVIDQFIDQIGTIDVPGEEIDILIESLGGDALTSWRLISLLRTRFKKVSVLIPHSAFSAATLLAMGADEILMGDFGSLGPIDPQITVARKDGKMQKFGYEEVVSFLDFVREEGHVTEQQHMQSALEKLFDAVEPTAIGFAKRSSSLSISMGEKMLQMHMTDPEAKAKANAIAKKLNKSFFSHGHAVTKREAAEIGLNIVEPSKEIADLMWSVHTDFEKELKNREIFDPIAEFLRNPLAKPYLSSPPPLHVPSAIMQNQQALFQLLQNHFNQQLNVTLPEPEVELKHVCVESIRLGREQYSRSRILLQRDVNLQFAGNMVHLEQGWRDTTVAPAPVTPTPEAEPQAGSEL